MHEYNKHTQPQKMQKKHYKTPIISLTANIAQIRSTA